MVVGGVGIKTSGRVVSEAQLGLSAGRRGKIVQSDLRYWAPGNSWRGGRTDLRYTEQGITVSPILGTRKQLEGTEYS